MTWWRGGFNTTLTYQLPSGYGADGEAAYSASKVQAACKHEQTSQLEASIDDEEQRITDVFQTEAPLVELTRVWPSGADTSDASAALIVRKVDASTDIEDPTVVLREVWCG